MGSRGLCFACGRRVGRNPHLVTCADEQDVFVGSECFKPIKASQADGWQPPKGGPRLYSLKHDPKGRPTLLQIGVRLEKAHGRG